MTLDGEQYSNCRNEQEFKMKYLKNSVADKDHTFFCIETEETIKGFPDAMIVDKKTSLISFQEFKFVRDGRIHFQPTQPAFYKAHPELTIYVVALDTKKNFVYVINVKCLFDSLSPYKLNECGEVLV